MTTADERYRAILTAERFLIELLDSKTTPRVPKHVRERARHILRHYPGPGTLDCMAHDADYWLKPPNS